MRFVSWNIAHIQMNWRELATDQSVDVALLQEAVPPPEGLVRETIPGLDVPWITTGARRNFCTSIARLSDRVKLRQIPTPPLSEASQDDLGVSLPGTIAASEVFDESGDTVVLASVYGAWGWPVPWKKGGWIYADAAVHRLISDLSALVAAQRGHRIIVAGDLNILYGHGEDGSEYWKARYQTVFVRMEAIGLPFVGPQHPHGEQTTTWPRELPKESKNVPTFRTKKGDPASATRQLDFVFASRELVPRIRVVALNKPEEWGPSDHCRIQIDLGERERETVGG